MTPAIQSGCTKSLPKMAGCWRWMLNACRASWMNQRVGSSDCIWCGGHKVMFGLVGVLADSSSQSPEARIACWWICTKEDWGGGLLLAHSRVKLVTVYCLVGVDRAPLARLWPPTWLTWFATFWGWHCYLLAGFGLCFGLHSLSICNVPYHPWSCLSSCYRQGLLLKDGRELVY